MIANPVPFIHVSDVNFCLRELLKSVFLSVEIGSPTLQIKVSKSNYVQCTTTGENLIQFKTNVFALNTLADVIRLADMQFCSYSFYAYIEWIMCLHCPTKNYFSIQIDGDRKILCYKIPTKTVMIDSAIEIAKRIGFQVTESEIEQESSMKHVQNIYCISLRTGEIFFSQEGWNTFVDGVLHSRNKQT